MTRDKNACSSCGGMGVVGSVCEYCGTVIQLSIPMSEKESPKMGEKTVSGEQYAEKISKYQTISEYYGELAIVSIGRRFGLIDRKGNLAVGLIYDNICSLLKNKGLFVLYQKGKCALVNDDCMFIFDMMYDSISVLRYGNDEYILTAMIDAKWALFDIAGKPLTDFKYNEISPINRSRWGDWDYTPMGLFKVFSDCGLGVIRCDGKEIIPCNCASKGISIFGKEFLKLEQRESVGLFDIEGCNILPCEYHSISPFYRSDRYVITRRTKNGDTLGVFDLQTQKEVLPSVYSLISEYLPILVVGKVKKHGIYNIEAEKLIIPCQYNKIEEGKSRGEWKLYYDDDSFFTIKIENGILVEENLPKRLGFGAFVGVLCLFVSVLCCIIAFTHFQEWLIYVSMAFLFVACWLIFRYCRFKKYKIR